MHTVKKLNLSKLHSQWDLWFNPFTASMEFMIIFWIDEKNGIITENCIYLCMPALHVAVCVCTRPGHKNVYVSMIWIFLLLRVHSKFIIKSIRIFFIPDIYAYSSFYEYLHGYVSILFFSSLEKYLFRGDNWFLNQGFINWTIAKQN